MFDRSIDVIVWFADNILVVRLRENTGRSTVCWRLQTKDCEGFSLACWRRRSDGAASNSWRGSPECIATPSRWANGNCGKNVACPAVVCDEPALAESAWKINARGTLGLAGTFARCHRRRSNHRHEVDPSFAAKALQGLAASWSEVVSSYPRTLAATFAILSANLSQTKSGNPASRSGPPISLPASASELVFDSKLAGN